MEKKEKMEKIEKTENGYFYKEEYIKSLSVIEILNLMTKEKSLQHTVNAVKKTLNKEEQKNVQ